MNYGNYGRDLLLELKRTDATTAISGNESSGLNVIPPYNDGLVSSAMQDLKLHVQALNEQVEAAANRGARSSDGTNNNSQGSGSNKAPMEVRPSLMLQEAAIQRNKRCLLAYHFVRLQRIQQIHYWQASSVSPTTDTPPVVGSGTTTNRTVATKNLCPAEIEFLESYKSIVSRYVSNAIPGGAVGIVDLRTCAVIPPLTVDRVVVRVIDETPFQPGPVVLESGQTLSFLVGGTYYLQYSDCEAYIRSGALQLLDTEEQEG